MLCALQTLVRRAGRGFGFFHRAAVGKVGLQGYNLLCQAVAGAIHLLQLIQLKRQHAMIIEAFGVKSKAG